MRPVRTDLPLVLASVTDLPGHLRFLVRPQLPARRSSLPAGRAIVPLYPFALPREQTSAVVG
jgi:hypothetical protein